jgi:hypothetical protein
VGRLDGVKKNVTEMSLEELREYVRHIRQDRRITKAKPKEKKERVANVATGKARAVKSLRKLTPEQHAALLAELEGDAEGST